MNPAAVITWNSDKTYLRDLADAGLPVVATTFAAPGEAARLPLSKSSSSSVRRGDSRGAGRFAAGAVDVARDHVTSLHDAGRTVLVQPYVTDVDTVGETALVYLDGVFSHAVSKGAMLASGMVHPADGYGLYVEETDRGARGVRGRTGGRGPGDAVAA